ncbi:MAG TPA: hypothetical protein VJL60_00970, partial [Gammaproteobacteria bacterium]|nr:hypothetical protein [Gammaproteobacteria bacterium]
MAIKDRIKAWGRNFLDIKNVDVKRPKSTDFITTQQSIFERSNKHIKEWIEASETAQDTSNPDRFDLMDLYYEIRTDAHLSAIIDTRKENLLSIPISFADENGEINEDVTNRLNRKWFYDFMSIVLDKIFYGFEVVEFGEIKNDEFLWVEKVKEQFVIPQFGEIKLTEGARAGSSDNIKLDDPRYAKWMLSFGDKDSLGLLDKACPLVI